MAEFSINPTRFDPYKNFKFRIKWDGRYVAGVSKISGLRRSTEVTQHREGGDPSSSRKSPGQNRILAHRAEVRLNMDISIRKAEPSDAEAIWKCYTAPQAVRNTLQLPYRSLESVRDLLNKSGEGDHILVAIIDGEVVGVIGLHTSLRPRVNHRAEIGMMVRDDWQGKGVGTAMIQAVIDLADRWLNLTRIELTVFTDNEPAIALYRKFGFEIEGALRKYAFRDGEFVDAYAMARVK